MSFISDITLFKNVEVDEMADFSLAFLNFRTVSHAAQLLPSLRLKANRNRTCYRHHLPKKPKKFAFCTQKQLTSV